jgi:hypothetical protein
MEMVSRFLIRIGEAEMILEEEGRSLCKKKIRNAIGSSSAADDIANGGLEHKGPHYMALVEYVRRELSEIEGFEVGADEFGRLALWDYIYDLHEIWLLKEVQKIAKK